MEKTSRMDPPRDSSGETGLLGMQPADESELDPSQSDINEPAASAENFKKLGPYRIERVLGQGGMGKVLLGEDEKLLRKSAIKVIAPHLATSEDARTRLESEARAAARLNHPNIVQVYYFGEEQGHTFIAFEYIDGRDLDSLIKTEGPVDLRTSLDYIRQAAKGLRFGYSQNVIHRDIKPANLMMVNGVIKVADFGLAKELDKDFVKTRTDVIIGSPAYMSPEQGMGRTLDFRSDIYSLGATLYALLSARVPFVGESALSVLLMHANEPVPETPEISQHLQGEVMGLILKMMSKKTENRHQSYDELIADIDALLDAEKSGTRPRTSFAGGSSSPAPGAPSANAGAGYSILPGVGSTGLSGSKQTGYSPPKKGGRNLWLAIMGLAGLILTIAIFIMIFSSGGNNQVPSSASSSANPVESTGSTIEQSLSANEIPTVSVTATPAESASIALPEIPDSPVSTEIDLQNITMIQADSITPQERVFGTVVARNLMATEIQTFDTLGPITPITIRPPQWNMNITLEEMGQRQAVFVSPENERKTYSPRNIPAELKMELAKFVSENTPALTPADRYRLDFFRYMQGDDRILPAELLTRAPDDQTRQSSAQAMGYRQIWEELMPTPPQTGNNPRNRPGPLNRPRLNRN